MSPGLMLAMMASRRSSDMGGVVVGTRTPSTPMNASAAPSAVVVRELAAWLTEDATAGIPPAHTVDCVGLKGTPPMVMEPSPPRAHLAMGLLWIPFWLERVRSSKQHL